MKTTTLNYYYPRRLTIIAVVCCLASAITAHALNVITFENIPGMANAPGTPIPSQSQLSTQYLPTLGVSFSSGSPYVAVVDVGSGAATSGTNTIGGSTPGGNLTYSSAYPIVATFFDPSNPSTFATTDFVSLRCDLVGSGLNVTLNAYGINNNLLSSVTTTDVGGETLQVSGPGIHSVQFIGTIDSSGATVDDFSFDTVVPVPEPSAGALLLVAGVFFCGIWRKNRHASVC